MKNECIIFFTIILYFTIFLVYHIFAFPLLGFPLIGGPLNDTKGGRCALPASGRRAKGDAQCFVRALSIEGYIHTRKIYSENIVKL